MKSLIQTHWDRREERVFRYKKLASFPGSLHKRTKNQKGRGKPDKVYTVRNVIGRENLITSGWMNELTHALWTEYTHSLAKAY